MASHFELDHFKEEDLHSIQFSTPFTGNRLITETVKEYLHHLGMNPVQDSLFGLPEIAWFLKHLHNAFSPMPLWFLHVILIRY